MRDDIRNLIFQMIDRTITPDAFDRLQDAIEADDEVRAEYLAAVGLCETLTEIAGTPGSGDKREEIPPTASPKTGSESPDGPRQFPLHWLAIAAAVLVVGSVAFWFGQKNSTSSDQVVDGNNPFEESSDPLMAGHATLRRTVDVQWPEGTTAHHEGDVLPNGPLQFSDGLAEIDFFCGATLIVEGPTSLVIESDWSVRVAEGRLRASVPRAARGFVVKAGDSEIVDLGTEFALEVAAENARVEVIDGEVELRGGEFDGRHLTTGQRQWLNGVGNQPESIEAMSTDSDLQKRRDDALMNAFGEWKTRSQELRTDDRLIAYFPIAEGQHQRIVRNAASTGSLRDGLIIGPVERTSGRFGTLSTGLEFGRTGARVRTRIDGDFQAFTFAAWVRIDSLDHRYNALFMADGYENGEPHWQIRDDGKLMFSVMVDDTQRLQRVDKTEQKIVTTAGRHHVYFTEPFWDISQSGQWFHLAAVYDPARRSVRQFVNGRQLSSEEISDEFHIAKLAIGPAELGNWGQPFRRTPWFSVRNLNGTIDEMALYDAALPSDDIQALYERGKPLGY